MIACGTYGIGVLQCCLWVDNVNYRHYTCRNQLTIEIWSEARGYPAQCDRPLMGRGEIPVMCWAGTEAVALPTNE